MSPAGRRAPASAAPEEILLEATDLAVTPPGAPRPTVHGISLRVGAGEWLALAGSNGGGKTSLLLALAGLWPITSGTLTLDGRPFGPGSGTGASAGVTAVLQDPSSQLLQPSVGEELAFTARNLGMAESAIAVEVDRWATALGLGSELALDPGTLSAGRQQLVLLGAALIARPRLLLADEPTAHLDASSRARIRAAIAQQVAGGLAVVWATQDRQEMEVASRTVEVGPARGPTGPGFGPRVGSSGAEARGPEGPDDAGVQPPVVLELELAPVTVERGPRIRVAGPVTLRLGAGVTALVGPNGSGKSVLLAAAAGLEPLTQVRVRWARPPVPPPILALQFPEQQVFEEQVVDELAFAAVARGLDRAKALEVAANHLRDLGLDPGTMMERRTWTLSTGEKRLVEVIGALIAPSSMVLLDEPTAGLDEPRREALARLVAARGRHVPVLVASQDLGWVGMAGARCFEFGR